MISYFYTKMNISRKGILLLFSYFFLIRGTPWGNCNKIICVVFS